MSAGVATAVLPRSQFPVTGSHAYFDVSSVGPPSLATTAAVHRCFADFAERGSLALFESFAATDAARGLASRLLGATPESVGFVRSTSAGLNQVVRGLGLQSGGTVAVPYGEFPTVGAAATGTPGVTVRWVNPDDLAPTTLDDYRRALAGDGRGAPDLVIAPWVDRGYGAVDLAELSRLCHDAGSLLCVDLMRGAGVLPAALDQWGVDFAVTGTYKWLLAGPGLGLLYVNPRHLDRLQTLEPGWLSLTWDSAAATPQPHADARRFEGGTPAIPLLQGLATSLGQLLDAGPDALASHVAGLGRALHARLAEAGLPEPVPETREGFGPSAVLRVPFESPPHLAERLAGRGVVCAASAKYLLVSCHGFNDQSDVDRLVTELAGALRTH